MSTKTAIRPRRWTEIGDDQILMEDIGHAYLEDRPLEQRQLTRPDAAFAIIGGITGEVIERCAAAAFLAYADIIVRQFGLGERTSLTWEGCATKDNYRAEARAMLAAVFGSRT